MSKDNRLNKALKIKHVGVQQRCEVCHQDDLYDGLTNYCSRCQGLYKEARSEQTREEIANREGLLVELLTKETEAATREAKRVLLLNKRRVALMGMMTKVLGIGLAALMMNVYQPLGSMGRGLICSIMLYLMAELYQFYHKGTSL